MTPPARGFPPEEFRARTRKAQHLMGEAGLSALLLTTPPEVCYYTGFLTQFWESPTRPWFVIVPERGDPVAVIPTIGASLMGRTWITDIRTWTSPNYADDGIGLLAEALRELVQEGGRIGVADGMESHLRMPLAGFSRLKAALDSRDISSDAAITRRLRLVKSDAEIEKIRRATGIADRAFARVGEIARAGVPLGEVSRRFQGLCLAEGADWVPYLASAAGAGGYGDVISPATEAALVPGDVMMLDTGLVWDGYFCDFDRNYSVGPAAQAVREGHARLVEASAAAFDAAKPGATIRDLFQAMRPFIGSSGDTGRLGHGLGLQLTEWPSILAEDETVLEAGMVLTLEPLVEVSPGKILVHEENIVIRPTGAEYLSQPQNAEIRVV
ncbi:MAG: Xaa-Pro peptidase family protein [Pseudomonadota bacterium]